MSAGDPARVAPEGPTRVARRFPARAEPGLAELHAAFEVLFQRAESSGVPVASADRVAILTAAGEIGANIVRHACGELPDAEVTLILERGDGLIEARFEDPGQPFVAAAGKPGAAALLPGGLGLAIARLSVEVLEYTREGAGNRWRLVRRTGDGGERSR